MTPIDVDSSCRAQFDIERVKLASKANGERIPEEFYPLWCVAFSCGASWALDQVKEIES